MSAAPTAPGDDSGAHHLQRGRRMPDIELPTTAGTAVSFARLPGRAVVYAYPWTGRPGVPNPPGWDDIPGAHGSTPQAEGFRDLHAGFRQVETQVFGLSTQAVDYQRELVARLGLPFALVSDAGFALARALALPPLRPAG
jgi:peroxiredoxin